jgi:hypothetical protein
VTTDLTSAPQGDADQTDYGDTITVRFLRLP